MTIINKMATVDYSQRQMYDLVNDVPSYSQFIPWCESTEVLRQSEDEIEASMTFASSGLQKSFTTCNRLQPHKMIEIRLLDGPFKHLEGFWRFEALETDKQSRVSLDLEFEFSSHFISLLFGPLFNQVAHGLVDVFCDRAKAVYDSQELPS